VTERGGKLDRNYCVAANKREGIGISGKDEGDKDMIQVKANEAGRRVKM
jgi:hypothetical protein